MLNTFQIQLLEYFELCPAYESSRVRLSKPTKNKETLEKDLNTFKGSVLALNLAKTPYIGLLITDEILANLAGFEPVYPDFATFLTTNEGVLYLFDRKTVKDLPKALKGVDLELIDSVSQRPLATLVQGDKVLILTEEAELPPVGGLKAPPALPQFVFEYPELAPVEPPKPLIESQVQAQIDMFIGYVSYKAFFCQQPLSTYAKELQSIYTQIPMETPLDHHMWRMTRDINLVQRETGWLLPSNFSDESIDYQQLTFEQLKDKAFKGIQENIENSQKRMGFAVDLLAEAAKMPFITKMEKTLFIKFLVIQSRLGLNQNEMSKQLGNDKYHHYVGKFGVPVIEIVAKQLKGQGIIKCPDTKQLWWWEGTQYVKLSDLHIKKLVVDYVHFINQHCAIVKQLLRTTLPMSSLANLKEYFLEPLCSLPEELQPVQAINLSGGILKANGKLISHNPSYGMNYKYPVDRCIQELATPPKLEAFLFSVWGHKEAYPSMLLAFQQALAATLFGVGTLFQRAILLYGVADSGKTQLLNIVRGLIPKDKITTLEPQRWAYKHNQIPLSHSLLNVCGELSDETLIKSHEFKQVIDGSNSDPRSLATHWFASNHLPQSTDTSQGFSRRWLVFEFDKILQGSPTLDIGKRIALEEKNLITQWAMQAMTLLQSQGEYSVPQDHSKILLQIYNRKNVFSEFLSQSNVVEFVWDQEKYNTIKQTPKEVLQQTLLDEPYLLIVELLEQARFWVRGQGRANNPTLSIASATVCLTEMSEQLRVYPARADQGGICFGVRLNTKTAKTVGAIDRKGYSPQEKQEKKLEKSRFKLLPWDRPKPRKSWRELDD